MYDRKKNGQFVFPSVHFICILFPLRSLRNTLKKQIPPEFHAQSSTVHKRYNSFCIQQDAHHKSDNNV